MKFFCHATAICLLLTNFVVADEAETSTSFSASHKQIATIEVQHDGKSVPLNTFALDGKGNLLACVTANKAATDSADEPILGYLQQYSPDGKLLRETPLGFVPTAVNVTPDSKIIVAGTGKVARLSDSGQVLEVIPSPHFGDVATLTERVSAEANKQIADVTKRYEDMIKQVDERIKAIEGTPEDERTSRDTAMLKSLPTQKKAYEDMANQMKESYSRIYSPEALLKRKMGITSVAVTSKDIFLCCNAIEGNGYQVWRMDHDLSSPKQIMTGLGGCCGQCDVQAAGDNLVIGENTKFQVTLVNRDGERLTSFGKKDRTSENGFGSCCNPMNVKCCSNGDIITSESSVGNIKRYSKDGEYLGLIGKAKISGGCKHVAVAIDEKRNRFYTMNIDKDHICVLVPLSEAPEYSAEELTAKNALDAHGSKLFGTWEIVKADGAAATKTNTVSYTVKLADGTTETRTRQVAVRVSSTFTADQLVFKADGSLDIKGGTLEQNSNTWTAVSHDKGSITLAHLRDGIHYYNFVVKFTDKDSATITLQRDGSNTVMTEDDYKRTSCGDDCKKSTEATTEDNDAVTTTAIIPENN